MMKIDCVWISLAVSVCAENTTGCIKRVCVSDASVSRVFTDTHTYMHIYSVGILTLMCTCKHAHTRQHTHTHTVGANIRMLSECSIVARADNTHIRTHTSVRTELKSCVVVSVECLLAISISTITFSVLYCID